MKKINKYPLTFETLNECLKSFNVEEMPIKILLKTDLPQGNYKVNLIYHLDKSGEGQLYLIPSTE